MAVTRAAARISHRLLQPPARRCLCAQVRLGPEPRVNPMTTLRRRLSTSTNPGATDQAAAAGEAGKKKASEGSAIGNFLSNNAGKLVLAALGCLGVYLYRSAQSTKRSKALKERVEGRRAVDPWEIDELRLANDQLLTPARFHAVVEAVKEAFPQGTASYPQFIKLCTSLLSAAQEGETGGPLPSGVKLGHYLDRVVLTAHPQGTDIGLMTLLAALSLTYNTLETERIALLHDLTATLYGRVDREALEQLVRALVATAQCPVDSVVEMDKDREYPFQEYKVVADPALLVPKAYQELEARKKDPVTLPNELTVEELGVLLSTKAICAWGECYHRRG